MDKAIVTCAVTGVLTNPQQHPVPVTPEEMAASAKEAFDAGASMMHLHFRNQNEGMGYLPTWEPEIVHRSRRRFVIHAQVFRLFHRRFWFRHFGACRVLATQ